jgi:Sec-independent protein secretion pathway components
MFFGIDMEKIVIILVVAALLLGPERLPHYAELLAKLTVRVRDWLTDARSRVKDEMGEEFEEIDWRKLDPRQYDPRRIIREALIDDAPLTPPASRGASTTPVAGASAAVVASTATAGSAASAASASPVFRPDGEVPFDSEAT